MMTLLLKRIVVWGYNFIKKLLLNHKVSRIQKTLENEVRIGKNITIKHKELWGQFNSKPNLKWLKVYSSINGIIDHRYITEVDYYCKVEPRLNHRGLSEAYCDKNIYHKIIDHNFLPRIHVRNIEGVFYNEGYFQVPDSYVLEKIPTDSNKIIIKNALDSGGGRGVMLLNYNNGQWNDMVGSKLTLSYLKNAFKKNYIIQEYIEQHQFYRNFNQSSVNTIRILTYRSVRTNEIIPIQSVLRIGHPGSIVDNQASGGVAVGIRPDGVLNAFAVNKKGNKIYSFNGVLFKDIGPLLSYKEIVETGIILASNFHYHRLLGFDFTVDRSGSVKLIEVNNRNNEINFFQMSNGPLFTDYTDEIVKYCRDRLSSFAIDFEI